MKISSHSLISAIATTLIVIAIAMPAGMALELGKPDEQASPSSGADWRRHPCGGQS
jgi:hypothetical protein